MVKLQFKGQKKARTRRAKRENQ